MVQATDAGTRKGGAGAAKAATAKAKDAGGANPKSWNTAQQAAKLSAPPPPRPPTGNGPTVQLASTASPGASPPPNPPRGGIAFHGNAGVGTATSTPVPDVARVPPTLKTPYDPAVQLNRLKSDGDTATFAISAGAGFAVPTPWTAGIPVGPQASAGVNAVVKQVGGSGPGQPATAEPPKYTVTFDKNQSLGLYATEKISTLKAGASPDAYGNASLELDLKHADRVTMTFDSKEDAARCVRVLESQAEAQALRDVKTVVTPSINVPDPRVAAQNVIEHAKQEPLGTALDAVNPLTYVKAGLETGKTIADGVAHDVSSLFGNPLKGGNGDSAPPPGTIEVPVGGPVSGLAGQGMEALAREVEPSAADKAFLQSHVTSYEEALTAQERATVELKVGSMISLDPRLAATQTLTRTVTLPTPPANGAPGKPGTVSYEAKFGLDVNSRDRLKLNDVLKKIGVRTPDFKGDPSTPGANVNTVVTMGQVFVAAKLTYEMTPAQSDALRQSRGTEIPGMLQMGEPKALDTTLSGRVIIPQPASPFGAAAPGGSNIYGNFKLQSTLANPASTLGATKDQLLSNGVPGAIETLARNSALDGELTLTKQEGGNVSAVLSASVPKVGAEVYGIVTGTAQTDTVLARAHGRLQWEEPPAITTPPPVDVPPHVTPPPQAPQPYQVAVVPLAGLNIRAEPGTDAKVLGPAYSGTFLQATGQTRTDAQGREWVEVHGPDMFRTEQKGWVASEYVERHEEGAMAEGAGRINELRQAGYVPITVREGDTISGIALKNGVDPSKAVTVNNGHVIDVDRIYPGDTVYIPGR